MPFLSAHLGAHLCSGVCSNITFSPGLVLSILPKIACFCLSVSPLSSHFIFPFSTPDTCSLSPPPLHMRVPGVQDFLCLARCSMLNVENLAWHVIGLQLELLNEGGDEQTRLGRQIQASWRVGISV